MALETFGEDMARMINQAVIACHDIVKDSNVDAATIASGKANFVAGQKDMWLVCPSMLDGKPAVEIRICVG